MSYSLYKKFKSVSSTSHHTCMKILFVENGSFLNFEIQIMTIPPNIPFLSLRVKNIFLIVFTFIKTKML